MAHQFRPVDRGAEMLLPPNMLDWVPEGHAVLVVIEAVETVMTPGLLARLVPPSPEGTARGPARYDPVMLLTVWMYAYLRGVLSTRALEDRCRYDATFRVACGREVPDHTTFSRFRKRLFGQEGLAEDLFFRVLDVCACAGLGRLSVVAADGVKIAASASKEANRSEAGLRKLAGKVLGDAREAAAADEAQEAPLPGTDLLLDADVMPDPRSRAGRVRACLEALAREREAAEAQARERGQAYLGALEAGTAPARCPAGVAAAAAQIRLEKLIVEEEAKTAEWEARKAAGQRVTRPPLPPGTSAQARKAADRLEELKAADQDAADGKRKQPVRNVTDPESRLLPVRGGGFIQGFNCQDGTCDDRLMLGGYACQDTSDQLQALALDGVMAQGAAVVAAGHAAHAGDPGAVRACHQRMCALPEKEKNGPGHDAAACHHAMTSAIGVIVKDAGYHSKANLQAPGPDRITAPGKTRDLPAVDCQPAGQNVFGPLTAVEANARRIAAPEGRALYKRRAPDVEGLHASLKDDGGLRRFSLRGLRNATSEFLFAGIGHNLRLLTALS
jgi:transposase